jgi:hypothetical protein
VIWQGGTEMFVSVYAIMTAPVYHPKNKKVLGNRIALAWSAGSGFPAKKYDKYFVDIIEKSIVIIIK